MDLHFDSRNFSLFFNAGNTPTLVVVNLLSDWICGPPLSIFQRREKLLNALHHIGVSLLL